MKKKLAYWIHGKMGSGKTELAHRIAGENAVVIHQGCTSVEITRIMEGAKAVIVEEYREVLASHLDLIKAAFLGTAISKGNALRKEVKEVNLDIDVMVVVSEFPPEDESVRGRFHVIEIGRPSRQNVQVHPRRAADGIQTGGLSASDETPCSDSSFSCAEFWDEESPGGFGMESAIFWVRRKAKLQEVAMKWLESKIAEVPDPQLQSAIAALINP